MARKGPGQILHTPRAPEPGAASSSRRGVVGAAQPLRGRHPEHHGRASLEKAGSWAQG